MVAITLRADLTRGLTNGEIDANFNNLLNELGLMLPKSGNLSGLSNVAAARTNLGLEIGTHVQAWDADLDAIAALAGTTGFLKKTAANTWALDTNTYLTTAVTSVAGAGTVSGLTLTGTVTSTGSLTLGGTLAVTASNFASQTANTFLAAPNGAAGVPTFRTLVAADVPTLNQNTTGSSASCTGNAATATIASAVNGASGQMNGDGWWRSTGATGWFSTTYSVGIYATEASNVRTYNGANFIAAGNVTAYSDERVKTNWRDLPSDYIEQLAGLLHGIYDRTDTETPVTQVGVGAQSLQKFLPQAIVYVGDKELTVNYGGAALVSAVQLAKRLIALEAKVAKIVD